MGLSTYRAKNAGAKFTGRLRLADARKDIALIKNIELGIDPKRGKKLDIKLGSDVDVLIAELKKTAGTPEGTALRHEIIRVVSKARREVACKARAKAFGRW